MRDRYYIAECDQAERTAYQVIDMWESGSRSSAAGVFQEVPGHRQVMVAALVAFHFRSLPVQDILDGVHFLATHNTRDNNGGSQ